MLREGIKPLDYIGVGKIQNPGHAVHVALFAYVLHHVATVLRLLRHDVSLDVAIVLYIIKKLLTLQDYHDEAFARRLTAALNYFDALLHVWIC